MKTRLVPSVVLCLLAVLLAACSGFGTHPKQVVFVCEHGAGRSVIAAAWFNKLAAEKQLPYRAVACGVTPQDGLSKPAVAGLKKDSVAFLDEKPRALSRQEANDAARVVSFVALPLSLKPVAFDEFRVPGPGDGYDGSRDAILGHVRKLIEDLQTNHVR
ncbi:MAG TPA: hypothetical protein VLC51_07530 [Nitrospira sp.]|nr:hypothetical protein [Nitrospira sp.]